jgi:ligand-binding SRPBCC domain-containing protein
MPVIYLSTYIKAPIEKCFDLSRSVDVHMLSTSNTDEKAVAGITSGLMGLNDTVTWRARHMGIYQHLTSKITAFEPPHFFVSQMVKGIFKKIYHRHAFKPFENGTLMIDIFDYEAPLGLLGIIADKLFLEKYMKELLRKRNECIKKIAEE